MAVDLAIAWMLWLVIRWPVISPLLRNRPLGALNSGERVPPQQLKPRYGFYYKDFPALARTVHFPI